MLSGGLATAASHFGIKENGAQALLAYALRGQAWRPVATYRKKFVASGICRAGIVSRRAFVKLRGRLVGARTGKFYETKPTTLLESTVMIQERLKKGHQRAK